MKQIFEITYQAIESDMTKEEFIAKVEKQHGYIDAIDSFRLVHFFTYEFGVIQTYMPVELELCYMYQKLKGNKVLKRDYYGSRKCQTCEIVKPATEYIDRVKHKRCAECVKASRKWKRNKIEE